MNKIRDKGKIKLYSLLFIYLLSICLPTLCAGFIMEPTAPEDISCYDTRTKFPPVLNKDFRPGGRNMYFIESSCNGQLRSRFSCAVESAARANPNWKVAILFVGPLKPQFLTSKTYNMLRAIPNLSFYRIYAKELSRGTPLENIFSNDTLKKSQYPTIHASDLLRLVILYLFGGLYLDLDMIVAKSFDTLPKNFIAHQDTWSFGAAILAVATDEIGTKFADIAIRDLAKNYNPDLWAGNANKLYERVLIKMCSTPYTADMTAENCGGFHILNYEEFYPYKDDYYKNISVPLPEGYKEVYTYHLWNSWGQLLPVLERSLLSDLASLYCPKTFDLYKSKFGS